MAFSQTTTPDAGIGDYFDRVLDMEEIEAVIRTIAGNVDCRVLDVHISGWNPQFGKGDELDFDTMIAFTGQPHLAYANTVREYVSKIWKHGDRLLSYLVPGASWENPGTFSTRFP